jgi:hypothetical protein
MPARGAVCRKSSALTLPGHLARWFIRRDHHVPALPSDWRDARGTPIQLAGGLEAMFVLALMLCDRRA